MKPIISIGVPIYNMERYLTRCIESIISQSYSELEIILVDDGSKDKSGQICDQYALLDNRIIVLHKENGGVSTARNEVLNMYSGDYLMFVDPDDYIEKDAVQVLYERIIADGSDMVIGKHANVYEDGSRDDIFCSWMKDDILSKQDIFLKLGDKNYYPVANCAKLYKKSVWEGMIYPVLTCGEDVWMFPLVLDRCNRISIIDKTVYFYYQHADSIVHNKTERAKKDDINAILHLVSYLWQHGIQKSAYKWYAIGIDKTLALQNKRDGKRIFKQYFDFKSTVRLLKGNNIKTKIKWLSLHIPGLLIVIKYAIQLGRKVLR